MKENITKKDELSKPNVQQSLSDFGAQLLTFNTDIKFIKAQLSKVQEDELRTQENLTQLINSTINRNNISSANTTINNSEAIDRVQKTLNDTLTQLESRLQSVNYTLSSRVDNIESTISGLKVNYLIKFSFPNYYYL